MKSPPGFQAAIFFSRFSFVSRTIDQAKERGTTRSRSLVRLLSSEKPDIDQ